MEAGGTTRWLCQISQKKWTSEKADPRSGESLDRTIFPVAQAQGEEEIIKSNQHHYKQFPEYLCAQKSICLAKKS